ncbi:Os04g0118000 [Oryza sativa Japonica Group]|uniref:Os04g0118000 protein n=1 Tax=Oryza sativa subsp. japonica TaxID=39947 RepID=A0A0P0W6T7_ORYSJ|nr:Os04g0118000 [Oryza sativa Japonica Group]
MNTTAVSCPVIAYGRDHVVDTIMMVLIRVVVSFTALILESIEALERRTEVVEELTKVLRRRACSWRTTIPTDRLVPRGSTARPGRHHLSIPPICACHTQPTKPKAPRDVRHRKER